MTRPLIWPVSLFLDTLFVLRNPKEVVVETQFFLSNTFTPRSRDIFTTRYLSINPYYDASQAHTRPCEGQKDKTNTPTRCPFSCKRNKLSIDMIECLECLKSWLSKDEWALDQEYCLKMKEDVLIGPVVVEQEGESIEQRFPVRSTLYCEIYGLQSVFTASKLTVVRLGMGILQYVWYRAYCAI